MTRSIETAWADLERLAKAATPGPWMVAEKDNNDQRIVTASYTEMATFWHHCVGSLETRMEANASYVAALDPATVLELIAASRAGSVGRSEATEPKPFDPAVAGELVEALQSLVDNLAEGDFISETRIDAARAALAKYATQQGGVDNPQCSKALALKPFCRTCQSIPAHGYCNLAGCPMPRPEQTSPESEHVCEWRLIAETQDAQIKRSSAPQTVQQPSVSTEYGAHDLRSVIERVRGRLALSWSYAWLNRSDVETLLGSAEANQAVGSWLSAALEDPAVCEEMKRDIREWFGATPQTPVSTETNQSGKADQ